MDNSEQFAIIDVVILFHRGECLREVGTGMEVPIVISLHKYPVTSKERGVGHDNEGVVYIGKLKHQGSLETRQKSGKSSLLFRAPSPGLVFMH